MFGSAMKNFARNPVFIRNKTIFVNSKMKLKK